MLDGLFQLFLGHFTLFKIVMGSTLLGVVSGALGTFAVLRKQSLLGDAISHAALPGICLAFLLTGSKVPLALVCGAAVAGWLGTLAVLVVVRASRVKYDSALGLVLSVFFGFGLMLLTYMQKRLPQASQAGLMSYLFGQAASLLLEDVVLMAVLGTGLLVIIVLFWKEFKLLSFDPDFAACLGLPVRRLDVLLITLLVVAIVLGLQTVGVVLMSAMLVTPGVAARQWTDRLSTMVVVAAGLGALAGVSGAVVSYAVHWPTGPTIVLSLGGLVTVSLLLAPQRGMVWSQFRHWRNRQRLHLEAVLADLHALAQHHGGADHGHPAAVLQAMSVGRGDIHRSLCALADRGLARRLGVDTWLLTPAGRTEAERLAQSRTESNNPQPGPA